MKKEGQHFGCDSELVTKFPLSNSLENVKSQGHANTVRQSKGLLALSTHTDTPPACELDNPKTYIQSNPNQKVSIFCYTFMSIKPI